MGGSKQPTTQTVTNAPPAFLEPYFRQGAEAATNLYNQGGGFYQGNTVAPLSSTTNQALELTRQRALNGNPLDRVAQTNTQRTLAGEFLGSNPFLDATADAANRSTIRQFRDATMPGLQGSFARAGRYGSNAQTNAVQGAQEALATGLADSNARLFGQEYSNERQRMLAAAQLAPSLTQTDFRNLSVLEGVGGTLDDQAQMELNARIQQATQPRTALDEYLARLNGVSGNYSNQTTTSAAPRTSRAAGALGGAATGAGMLGALGSAGLAVSGPVGWGILGASALGGALM